MSRPMSTQYQFPNLQIKPKTSPAIFVQTTQNHMRRNSATISNRGRTVAVVRGSRSEKVKTIFHQFDANSDGGLNREEMATLVVAVNPRVTFSEVQISAILDEVFKTYSEFIDCEKGLTYEGFLRTYEDVAGDVDRDFESLCLELKPETL